MKIKRVAHAAIAFLGITGLCALVLLLHSMGLTFVLNEYGNRSDLAKDVAYMIGISKFQLRVGSVITMVVCFLIAAPLFKKFP